MSIVNKKNFPRIDLTFLSGIVIYSILAAILIKYYQYQIDPNGISFISIAQKYARGDFSNAINGSWGPLLSWLLVPFLRLGFVPTYAVKVISLSTGLLTLIGIRLLSYKFRMSENIRNVIWFLLIPHVLYFASVVVNPDWLSVCFLVFYLNIIFDPAYSDRRGNGVFCGLLGGLAYLCKSYNFFFFILHFSLFNIFQYLRNDPAKRMKVVQNFILGLAVFSMISVPWIMLISNKYHKITVGTAGNIARNSFSPPESDIPFWYTLLAPPNDTAVSAGEDLSFIKLKSWSPFQSFGNFIWQLKIIFCNIDETIKSHIYFSLLAPAIILGYLLLLLASSKNLISQGELLYPLITLILYATGYIPISMDIVERHLWLNDILIALMGGYLLHVLFQNSFFNIIRKRVTLTVFALSFIAIPINVFRPVIANRYVSKDSYDLSKILKDRYNIQGNIASNSRERDTLFLSYYLNSKCYGRHKKNISDEEVQTDLARYNIHYYFVWDETIEKSSFLSNYRELTNGEIPNLRIYYLKGKIKKPNSS